MLTVFKRHKWLALRLGLIALNAIPYGTPNSAGKQCSPLELFGVSAFQAGAIPLLGFMGRIQGSISGAPNWRSMQWTRPEWGKSPLLLTEPSQFFHLAAFVLFSIGISRGLVQGEILSSTSSGAFSLANGIGVWIGTWLAVLLVGKGEWEKIGNENGDR